MKKNILIAGGSGFLGHVLEAYFTTRGFKVYILTRSPQQKNHVYWDGETFGEWIHTLNGCDILINLSGKSVNCRYNEANKREILQSRIKSTNILGQAIKISKSPPKIWINSSTATIYDHSEEEMMTEGKGRIGNDFSMNVAKAWENEIENLSIKPIVRCVLLRSSVVLGKSGQAHKIYNKLVKWGMGGYQGSGKQMVSWIHEVDFARGVEYIINASDLLGPVNLTSPNPTVNKLFMLEYRKVNNISFGLNHPVLLLKLGAFIIGTETELLLKSRFVYPKKLIDHGFKFTYPKLDLALMALR